MKFTQKEIKRAIRDFEKTISSLRVSGHNVYPTRVKELMNLISENEVLNSIVGPYLTMDVDFESIENSPRGDWIDLKLPDDKDLQIAYILQVMKRSTEGEFGIEYYAARIFRERKINENIKLWNEQILFPSVDSLIIKLEDLIEDEVEGKEYIDAGKLQIINYGSISADHGNVAIGKDIDQTIKIERISDEIINKSLEQGIINASQVDEVKVITDELQSELEKNNPSRSTLHKLASSIYDVGSKGLLSLSTNVVTNPRWAEAVTQFLLDRI